MARRVIHIHATAAAIISGLLTERDAVQKALGVAVNMVAAQHDIPVAVFVGLDGDSVLLDVSDEPDRVESPQTDAGVAGRIPAASGTKSPSESKPAGKGDDLGPSKHPTYGGVAEFQHSEASQ